MSRRQIERSLAGRVMIGCTVVVVAMKWYSFLSSPRYALAAQEKPGYLHFTKEGRANRSPSTVGSRTNSSGTGTGFRWLPRAPTISSSSDNVVHRALAVQT